MTALEFLLAAVAVLFVGIVVLIVGLNAVAKKVTTPEDDDWEDDDAYGCWREGVRLRREAMLRERK